MGESTRGIIYILIIKDDASSFVWLEPCTAADADTTVETLLKWFCTFGVVLNWISDRGTHFKNKVMRDLNRKLHGYHHFTTPYSPQSNGTVETVCKEVLRACRALLSEFRMTKKEWPLVLPLIQSILNHSVRPTLGNRAPITAFTGLPADNPLCSISPPAVESVKSIDEVRARRLINVQGIVKALDSIHRDISKRRNKKREAAIRRHNERTFVQPVNFEIGDFVLVAKKDVHEGSKLQVTWKGPWRIIRAVSDMVFECEDLISGKYSLFHANRLKPYADRSLNISEDLLDTIQHNDPHLQKVANILNLLFNPLLERYEVQVQWQGFDYEDPTWEPFFTMNEDIRDMLEEFMQSHQDQILVDAARNSITV